MWKYNSGYRSKDAFEGVMGNPINKNYGLRVRGKHSASGRNQKTKQHSPVMCVKQSRFLVLITNGTEITAYNFVICVLANVVLGHLEHPEMEISDRAERTARYEDDGMFLWIAENPRKAMRWK